MHDDRQLSGESCRSNPLTRSCECRIAHHFTQRCGAFAWHLANVGRRTISPDMPTHIRRCRTSGAPIRRPPLIAPEQIGGVYFEVLRWLEPYLCSKYATIPWLYYLSGAEAEYSVFRKRLAAMRQPPNTYIGCPEDQLASPNVDRKTLIYELRERGLNVLIDRGIIPRRTSPHPEAKAPSIARSHAFAAHRSNSYKHELIVDLGYHLPLRYLCDKDPALRLLDFAQLLAHQNVPLETRQSRDPLLVPLRGGSVRFDGTPHVIVRTRSDGVSLSLGIPGIQVDRTDSTEQIERHITHALAFVEERHHECHWGFDNCVIPFLFTREAKKSRAMQFLRRKRESCAFILFQNIPDYALLRHYPRPEHYDPAYHGEAGEAPHSDSIRIFTNPWQRVGCPDFYLNTFDERGGT
jgi:hypothetical protein